MKKINFVNKYEKKKMPKEKKFFYAVLTVCILAVAVTSFITTLQDSKSDTPKAPDTKEVLKSSQEETVPPEITENQPDVEVIIPEQPEDEAIVVSTPEIETPQTNETKIPEIAEIDSIQMPHDGKIIKAHSDYTPLFSKTMNDWRIHEGIDISANIGDDVFSCASGTVSDAYEDSELGFTVIVKHDGFVSKYANLSSVDGVKIGTEIGIGEKIGTVGDSAKYEIADDAHLHFEIIKDDISINPKEIIK